MLSVNHFPEFVAITETHLTKTIDELKLSNYMLVSRRDRPDQRGWGGIALFARYDVHANIVHLKDSEDLELSWHTLHSDIGPLLFGMWYRPPRKGDVTAITSLTTDWTLAGMMLGRSRLAT